MSTPIADMLQDQDPEKACEPKIQPPSDSATDGSAEEPSAPPAHHFPDGGIKAWSAVLGSWCVSFASFGYINSFGVYETYYLEHFLVGMSPSDVAWIGSIQAFAQFSATLISGPITDRYGPMVIIWPCSLLVVVAMMLTSLCTKYYQFILCQGILTGLCAGLIYAPALSVIGQYFSKNRAMAMAFASTGSPLGGLIYPVILTNLLHNSDIGFAWAQRICGFLSLFMLSVAAVAIRPTGLRRQGTFVLLDAFKKPVFSLQVAALFLVVLGLWTPYFYLADYGQENGMTASLASYLFAIINAGSFLGRIFGGTFAQNLGQFNVITFACFASAILLFCWLKIFTAAGLIVFSILFGATSGMVIAMMMPTIAHTADHPSQIGTYIGMATFVIGFGGLAGTPITGALINTYQGYTEGIVFSAAVIMAGAGCLSCARYIYAKDKLIA